MIYCEGVQPESTLHLAFANRTEALDYKKCRCRDDFGRCAIYAMLAENDKRMYGERA